MLKRWALPLGKILRDSRFVRIRLGAQSIEHADVLSEKKLISQPWVVPDPPSLAQMTFTQCTMVLAL